MNDDIIARILDLARWAPSGDNTQPWRFEIVGNNQIVIHGHDTRDWCVYDFEGHASHMAHGALLETLRIAATGFGLDANWALRPESTERTPLFDVHFTTHSQGKVDELFPYITQRVVQRRPMSTSPIDQADIEALSAAVGPRYELRFFTSWSERSKVAGLLWRNAYIRLTCREAYEVHKEVIDWGRKFSKDRIPQHAVGVDPATAVLMRWVMADWRRVKFFNRYLFGTITPRVQLDLLPALLCAGHILLRPKAALVSLNNYVEAGVAMQRLWLTTTKIGLYLQPEMTPVIFRWYVNESRSISIQNGIDASARDLARHFENIAEAGPSDPFAFFCRIGRSVAPVSRSTRQEVADLLV